MSRKILLVAALTVFAVSGQGQATNQPSANQPPATPTNAQYGSPITTTPTATFATPAPEAGISDAGRAGISVNSNAAAIYGTSSVAPDMTGTAPVATSPATDIAPAENTATNDLGASASVNAGVSDGSPAATSVGVAEIASRYKAGKTTLNARVLNNEDVKQILNSRSDVTTASNMPPQGAGIPAQNEQPQVAQDNASANQQLGTPAPASASQGQPTEANATTPQINQNQQSNDAQGTKRLPATSTFLPLLGLIGLASGSFGLWFRRFRK